MVKPALSKHLHWASSSGLSHRCLPKVGSTVSFKTMLLTVFRKENVWSRDLDECSPFYTRSNQSWGRASTGGSASIWSKTVDPTFGNHATILLFLFLNPAFNHLWVTKLVDIFEDPFTPYNKLSDLKVVFTSQIHTCISFSCLIRKCFMSQIQTP